MGTLGRNEQISRSVAHVDQVGGDHYQKPIQAWDYIVANKLGFLEGNVVKYVSRWEAKDGLKDLEKCLSYVQKLIEVEKARLAQQEPVKEEYPWAKWDGVERTNRYLGSDLGIDAMVEIEYRDGSYSQGRIRSFNWALTGSMLDIVKYRLKQD